MRKKKQRTPKNVSKAAVGMLAYVSEHPEKPQAKRVNEILELLTEIQSRTEIQSGRRKPKQDPWELGELLDHWQKAFRRYRWTREILFTTEGPHEMVTSARQQTDDDNWEYGAVGILLALAEYYPDRLSKIGRCEICRRWMLTRKSDHRFCSGKCRQYEYDNDPKRQEQHRANMQRLYRREKEREERAKQAVGFTTKPNKRLKKSVR